MRLSVELWGASPGCSLSTGADGSFVGFLGMASFFIYASGLPSVFFGDYSGLGVILFDVDLPSSGLRVMEVLFVG